MENRIHLKTCDCPDWRIGIHEIEDMTIYCCGRESAPKYTAPIFKYCPWCGYRRQVDKIYSKKYDSYFNPYTLEWLEEYSLWWKKKNGPRPQTAVDEEVPTYSNIG